MPSRIDALIAGFSFAVLVGCVRPNESHCANQQRDASCAARADDRVICSECESAHDGCVVGPIEEACRPDAPDTTGWNASGSATHDPSVASDASAGDASAGDASAGDASASDASAGDASASDASASGVSAGDASTGDASAGDETSGADSSVTTAGETGRDDATTNPAGTDDGDDASATNPTSVSATDAESSESTDGSFCGDGNRDPDEQCDGNDLNGATCLSQPNYAGGTLGCDQFCEYNTSQCAECLDLIGGCVTDEECCLGQHCNLGLCIL